MKCGVDVKKGKTAAGGGAICAIAVMITIVMGNGNVRTKRGALDFIGNAECSQN
ncbi:TPA: hypothetical protein U0A13_002826 [Escherichia coli]|nr:hypothetical protein [Escherichia coli]HEM0099765.1 hypothetical protein [Escherichia coli]HEM0847408.1 hypothetical protein [Escherichia coli]